MRGGIACVLITMSGLVVPVWRPAIGQDDGTIVSDAPVPETQVDPGDPPTDPPNALPDRELDADGTDGPSGLLELREVPSQERRARDPVIRQLPDEMQPGPLKWRERMRAPAPYPPPTFFDPQMRTPARVRVMAGLVNNPFYLGVSLQPVGEALRSHLKLDPAVGLLVEGIAADSPAAAVLQPYDVLTAVDDDPITQHADLVQAVQQAGTEERELKLSLIRAGQPQTVSVKPAQRGERELIFRSDSTESGVEEGVREWIPIPSEPVERVLPRLQRPEDDWFQQYRREHDELRQLIEQLRRDVDELRDASSSSEPDGS